MRLRHDLQRPSARSAGRGLSSLLTAAAMLAVLSSEVLADSVCYKGVNLSGAEYGDINGVYGRNYIYPSQKTVSYFADKGMNIVRVPFRWQRLQPVIGEKLDAAELERLKSSVEMIRSQGMTILLDPHNFGYYEDARLMTPELPAQAFAGFWIRLAPEFANEDDVIFGLMNEPYDIPADDWLIAVNRAIAGIRAVEAGNLILVPGTNWSGASSWSSDRKMGNNGIVMAGVQDPLGNFAYEVHQYMDEDFSGTHDTCPQAAEAAEALERFTAWLRDHDARGFLGEFGGSKDPACLEGLREMVGVIDRHPDRWLGWTYWAAGDWWPESEGNNIQPVSGRDRPQLGAVMQSPPVRAGNECSTVN
ncbi:glycoside hydrolase family 5 protein [Rhodobacterales bacterium]|nr:glycoside hydrolase family 5 protein [Rhodobacterales bacterium]